MSSHARPKLRKVDDVGYFSKERAEKETQERKNEGRGSARRLGRYAMVLTGRSAHPLLTVIDPASCRKSPRCSTPNSESAKGGIRKALLHAVCKPLTRPGNLARLCLFVCQVGRRPRLRSHSSNGRNHVFGLTRSPSCPIVALKVAASRAMHANIALPFRFRASGYFLIISSNPCFMVGQSSNGYRGKC